LVQSALAARETKALLYDSGKNGGRDTVIATMRILRSYSGTEKRIAAHHAHSGIKNERGSISGAVNELVRPHCRFLLRHHSLYPSINWMAIEKNENEISEMLSGREAG